MPQTEELPCTVDRVLREMCPRCKPTKVHANNGQLPDMTKPILVSIAPWLDGSCWLLVWLLVWLDLGSILASASAPGVKGEMCV